MRRTSPHGSLYYAPVPADLPNAYTRVLAPIETWALDNFRLQHAQAVVQHGERVILRRVWHWHDHRDGLVNRCTVCHAGTDAGVRKRISELYKQSGDTWCESCLGTGYGGGFKPEIWVTYVLITDAQERDLRTNRTGITLGEKPQVQFLHEPELRAGDVMFRAASWADEATPLELTEAYVLNTVRRDTIRTGTRRGNDEEMFVAQSAQVENVPREHPYWRLAVVAP